MRASLIHGMKAQQRVVLQTRPSAGRFLAASSSRRPDAAGHQSSPAQIGTPPSRRECGQRGHAIARKYRRY